VKTKIHHRGSGGSRVNGEVGVEVDAAQAGMPVPPNEEHSREWLWHLEKDSY